MKELNEKEIKEEKKEEGKGRNESSLTINAEATEGMKGKGH